MSNILAFKNKKPINKQRTGDLLNLNLSKDNCIVLQKELDDENSPLSIFKQKHRSLIKELHAICEECRNAYKEKKLFSDEEILLEFYVELADLDDPDVKSLFHTIRIDILTIDK